MARTRWPHLRVLLTSGHDRPAETHTEPLAETDLLPKPYTSFELLEAVARALGTADQSGGSQAGARK